MNRSLKLSIWLALALGASQASALDLGQIQIKSALGQPLLAEIPVTPGSPAELQNLSAKLASNEEFTRAGITDGRPNIPLQFSIADENGHKVIRITSSEAVNNPYLDLLVEVSSSAGSSVREFTILLDPPSNGLAQAAVSSAPTTHRASRGSTPAASASTATPSRRTSVASTRQAPAQAAVKNGEYGPVTQGQSLSAVARATAPDGIDTNQMMLALKAANPDAFYRDNINALKAGAVLRVPSKEDAQTMAIAAAAAAVRQQNGDWRSGAARSATAVADAGTRSGTSTAPTSNNASGDRLALVPAKEGAQGEAGSNGGKSAAGIRQELQRSQETLTSLQQQGADLKSRLKDLEDINSKNERLLSLKDNEIAELQQKLATARKSAGLPVEPVANKPATSATIANTAAAGLAAAAPASTATPAAAPAAKTAAATSAGSVAAAAPAAALTPAAPAKPIAKPVVHKPITPAPAPEEPWYMQIWVLAAGAVAVVLLLLLALRGRRKPVVSKAAAASSSTASLADRFGTAPSAAASADPDQDELLDQLAEHPDDVGLHLELVSLYYSRRDVDHFEAAAEAMHAHVTHADQDEWQDVVHMGEDLVPGHPLFAHAAPPSPPPLPPQNEDEHEALHHFDLGSYASEPALDPLAAAQEPVSANRPKVSEYHYDFDLTPKQTEAAAAAKHHESTSAPAVSSDDETVISNWKFDEPAETSHSHGTSVEHEFGELQDDPIDTKLDLARAYLDMGDPDGARAMLDEVMNEGSQMQRDVAKGLLAKLR